MNSCSINTEAPRWKETNEWRARIINFLDARLDHSFVTRFNDPTGIPVNVDCRNADAEHNLLYHLQYATNFRLEEFSKEPNF